MVDQREVTQVEITQEDRDAAASYHRFCRDRFTAHITDGLEDDTAIVQAFARSRLAGARIAALTPPARVEGGFADGVEAAAKVAGSHGSMLSLAKGHDDSEGQEDRWYDGGTHAAVSIAAAIRALSPEQGEKTLTDVVREAKRVQRLVQGCLECNADDERRWSETIEWLEGLA